VNAIEAIIAERAAAIARDEEHDPAAYDETVALTRAPAAVRSRSLADIKAKITAMVGSMAITAGTIASLPPEEQELVASILRDVLALN
jgi:hypothetical protein